MSRRHSTRTLDSGLRWNAELASPTPEEDTAPPTLDDWDPAYQHATLDVIDRVWRTQGAKYYAVQKDKVLRDDLVDWLIIEAINIAPHWECQDHDNPVASWRRYLHVTLTGRARWHFAEVVGRARNSYGRAAVKAFNAGIESSDRLTEDLGDSWVGGRHALHGTDWATVDPANVVIRMEEVARQLTDAERHLRDLKASGTYTTTSETCTEGLCNKPAAWGSALCRSHYAKQRAQWGAINERGCNVPGCNGFHKARGVCQDHYNQLKRNTLPPDLQQYVEAPKPRHTHCTVDGCTQPHHSKGYCRKHAKQARRDNNNAERKRNE